METSISTAPYSLRDLVTELGTTFIICLMVYIAVSYFLPYWYEVTALSSLSAVLLGQIFDAADKHRLTEIVFDTANRRIKLTYRSLITGTHHKSILFNDASSELSKPKWRLLGQRSPSLYILKKNKEVFVIKKNKDRVDETTMQQIVDAMQRHSIGVREV